MVPHMTRWSVWNDALDDQLEIVRNIYIFTFTHQYIFQSHKIVETRYQTLVTFFVAIWGNQAKNIAVNYILLPVLKFIRFLLLILFLFDLTNNRLLSFMTGQIPELWIFLKDLKLSGSYGIVSVIFC